MVDEYLPQLEQNAYLQQEDGLFDSLVGDDEDSADVPDVPFPDTEDVTQKLSQKQFLAVTFEEYLEDEVLNGKPA